MNVIKEKKKDGDYGEINPAYFGILRGISISKLSSHCSFEAL